MSGMQAVILHLLNAYQDRANREAFTAMSYAAYCSGVALTNSGLGMAHGIAAALGAICNISHGFACAVMLPVTLRTNYDVCKKDYEEIQKVCDPEGKSSLTLIESIQKLSDELGIPKSLSALGVRPDQIPELVKGSQGNSMRGNPIMLDDKKLTKVIESVL
jgi:alcohol dehydrogenase class IV